MFRARLTTRGQGRDTDLGITLQTIKLYISHGVCHREAQQIIVKGEALTLVTLTDWIQYRCKISFKFKCQPVEIVIENETTMLLERDCIQ